MLPVLSKLAYFLNEKLWEIRPDSSGKIGGYIIIFQRLLHKIGQEFSNGEIPRRASSLVYRMLLTFVPILAVSFSVVKAFGVHNMLVPFVSDFLAPLGEKGEEITLAVFTYVERLDVGLLGAIGLGTLIYTVMSAVQQVEESFNYLWQIREKRGLLRRFTDYMSVLLAGPVLIVAALGINTFLMSHSVAQEIRSMEPFGTAIFIIGKLLPYLLGSVAFTLIYYLLPYTKVSFKSAFVGGVSAGILWQMGSWMFARFIATSTQYSAIYSGFAMVLLFMIWLYYNWLILLTGVKIAFYHQFPALLQIRDDRVICGEWHMQRLAIVLMCIIGYDYSHIQHHRTLRGLMERVRMPISVVQDVLGALEKSGLILRIEADETFVPARDIETITLDEIVNSVRGEFHGAYSPLKDVMVIPGIEEAMCEAQKAGDDMLSRKTLKALVSVYGPDNEKTV